MLHQIRMYRYELSLDRMLLPCCYSIPGAIRKDCQKHIRPRKSWYRRWGVLFLLAVVGLGTNSGTYANQGPAGVSTDIELWLVANKDNLFSNSDCTNSISTSGEDVKCWKDVSGNNADVTIRGSSGADEYGAPTYLEDKIGGEPVLHFKKGDEDALIHWLAGHWQDDYTIFLVVQKLYPGTPQNNRAYFSSGKGGNRMQIGYGKNTYADSVWVWVKNRESDSTEFTSNSQYPRSYAVKHEGNIRSTYTNGDHNNTDTDADQSRFSGYQINLNRNRQRFNNSYIAEVVLYDRSLDDCEFYDVYAYLLEKYGFIRPKGVSGLNFIHEDFVDENIPLHGSPAADYIRVDDSADQNVGSISAADGDDIVYIKGWGEGINSSVDGGGGSNILVVDDSAIIDGNKIIFPSDGTDGTITYNNFDFVYKISEYFEFEHLEKPEDCNECPSGDTAPIGAPAPVSFSSKSLGSDTLLFQGQFDFDDWSGNLTAYELEDDGSLGEKRWDAASQLELKDLSATIDWTSYNDSDNATSEGKKFLWTELEGIQREDLRFGGGEGGARLQYLRGSSNDEKPGGSFRSRSSRLGDIFRSRPVYVGVPNLKWPDTGAFDYGVDTRYSDFSKAQQDRTPMVYVGANDGALHGFNADTGEELLRYFPGNLYSDGDKTGYHYLTDPEYDHLPYVDGTPVVSDAYIKTSPSGEPSWRTILVGTLGGGGPGLFALDVTNPEAFNSSESTANDIVLWEFTSDEFPELGYTYSRPTIALLNDGRWAAITGNDDPPGGSGNPTLLILYLDGGYLGTSETSNWSGESGDDDYRVISIDTALGGLSSPTVIDTDGDGDADRVYAGDTEGNLWVFNLSSSNPENWNVGGPSNIETPIFGDMYLPLFENDRPQSISVKPTVVRHPTVPTNESNEPNVLVLFGTGQLNTDDDKSDKSVQTFYGIWDVSQLEKGRTNLAEQTLFPDDNTRATNPFLEVCYESCVPRQYGWYIDLPADTGERVVSDAVARGDMVFFNTVIPTEDPCEYGGTGWSMSVRIKNGGSPTRPVVDQNNDDVFNNDDMGSHVGVETTEVGYSGKKIEDDEGLPSGPAIVGDKLFTRGSTESEQPKDTALAPVTNSVPVGRLSWEQLFPSQ